MSTALHFGQHCETKSDFCDSDRRQKECFDLKTSNHANSRSLCRQPSSSDIALVSRTIITRTEAARDRADGDMLRSPRFPPLLTSRRQDLRVSAFLWYHRSGLRSPEIFAIDQLPHPKDFGHSSACFPAIALSMHHRCHVVTDRPQPSSVDISDIIGVGNFSRAIREL